MSLDRGQEQPRSGDIRVAKLAGAGGAPSLSSNAAFNLARPARLATSSTLVRRWRGEGRPKACRRSLGVIAFAVLLCLPAAVRAGSQTQVNFDSGTQAMYNFGGTLLNPGTAVDGDGTVIQLGYYDGGTVTNPFAGTWHALTGEGSLNTGGDTGSGLAFSTTSIGDIGGGAAPGGSGVFGFSLVFDSAIGGTFNDLPGATIIPLAIRFYNGTTLASSSYYNTVSNAAWLWQTPIKPAPLPPIINLSFDDGGLQWESIALGQSGATAFHTTIVPVPEPDSLFHAVPCLAALAWRWRRGGRTTHPI